MIQELASYVLQHTRRGDCLCGSCCDAQDGSQPTGHTADLVFFRVVSENSPSREEFERLTRENGAGVFSSVDPLDGKEHSYLELGAWLGDQSIAMQYMGLGSLLGSFKLLTPKTLKLPDDLAMQMAQRGFLSVIKL